MPYESAHIMTTSPFMYLQVPVSDEEFDALNARIDDLPAYIRESIDAAESAREDYKHLEAKAKQSMERWAEDVLAEYADFPSNV